MTGHLVYWNEDQLVHLDATTRTARVVATGNSFQTPALSPDLDVVAYTDFDAARGNAFDVRGVPFSGEPLRCDPGAPCGEALVATSNQEYGPAWSSDGRLAYSLNGVYHVDGVRAHDAGSASNFPRPGWAPDGTLFAVLYLGDWGLYRVDPTSRQTTLVLADDLARRPAVSPDGSRIAYGRGSEIWVAGIDGSDARLLTTGMDPVWSPNGERIAFWVSGQQDPLFGSIFLIDPGGGEPVFVARGRDPTWQP